MSNKNRRIVRFLDPKADLIFKKVFGGQPDVMMSFFENHILKRNLLTS